MRHSHLWASFFRSSFLLLCCLICFVTAEEDKRTKTVHMIYPISSTEVSSKGFHAQEKQANPVPLDGLGALSLDLSSIAMFGIMGLPVLGALNFMVPLLAGRAKTYKRKPSSGKKLLHSTNYKSLRKKRDLPYAKELLDLLISVEDALESYGITAPQCQLRATCEIHRRGINDINSNFAENFIRLVRQMRDQIRNPKVVPLAKYVFEYYEEAAIRGESNCDCAQMYNRCPHSLDFFIKRRKGSRRLW